MIKKGFTLAEVLITLAILGVVAALTIPGLIANTQGRQYSVAYKKAIATFGQAINKSVGLDGVDMSNLADAKRPGTEDDKYQAGTLTEFARANLNVQRTNNNDVYLADGTMYRLPDGPCTAAAPCVVGVDVNGDASPNAIFNAAAGKLTDRYLMIVTDVAAMPYSQSIVNPDTGIDVDNGNYTGETDAFGYGPAVAERAAVFAMTGRDTGANP